MSGSIRVWIDRLDRWGTATENAVLVALLTSMILIAVGQIVLRLFFSIGFVWADELISVIVLWIALVASVAAARSDRHLRIDALSHFVSEKYARFPRIVVDAFAAGICMLLCWHSFRYIQLIRDFEDVVLTTIPAWLVFAVVPVSFGLMAYRFLLLAGSGALKVVTNDDSESESQP